jgi:hypothetical protein
MAGHDPCVVCGQTELSYATDWCAPCSTKARERARSEGRSFRDVMREMATSAPPPKRCTQEACGPCILTEHEENGVGGVDHKAACGCEWATYRGEGVHALRQCDTHKVRAKAMRSVDECQAMILREADALRAEAAKPPPPVLTLAEVEQFAREAAAKQNPAMRVVVDNAHGARAAGSDGFRVWFELGQGKACVAVDAHDSPAHTRGRLGASACQVCTEVGQAWRPKGWRDP